MCRQTGGAAAPGSMSQSQSVTRRLYFALLKSSANLFSCGTFRNTMCARNGFVIPQIGIIEEKKI